MKRLLLMKSLLVAAGLCVGASAWAVAYTNGSTVAAGNDYYLYNIGAGKFLDNGLNYGTRCTVDNSGQSLTLAAGTTDGTFTIKTNLKTTDNMGVGDWCNEGYMDGGTSVEFKFNPVSLTGYSNVYTIQANTSNNYMIYDASDLPAVNAKASLSGTNNDYWLLVPKSARLAANDITYLIKNASFNCTGDNAVWAQGGGQSFNYVAEKFNTTFDNSQTVNVPTPGKYRIKVKGFYRYGNSYGSSDEVNSYLYATGISTVKVNLPLIITGTSNSALYTATGDGAWMSDVQQGDVYVPNSTNGASAHIAQGKYAVTTLDVDVVSSLTLGVKCDKNETNSWTVFDDFEIEYLGALTYNNTISYNFKAFTGSDPITLSASGTSLNDREVRTLYIPNEFADEFGNKFALQNANQWKVSSKDGLYNNTASDQCFAIRNLKTGDAVKVTYTGLIYISEGKVDSRKSLLVDGNGNIPSQWSTLTSEALYYMRADGSVGLQGKKLSDGGAYISNITIYTNAEENVAVPTISSVSAEGGREVTITSGSSNLNSGVTTYYTTDGSTPTSSSIKYTGTFLQATTANVKAITISNSSAATASAVTEQLVNLDVVDDPVMTVTGTSDNSRIVTITCATDGANIYYSEIEKTNDEEGWSTYSGPVTTAATTLYAYAGKGATKSAVVNLPTGAGTTINLLAATIAHTAANAYTISNDQSSLLGAPTATVHYQIDGGAEQTSTAASLVVPVSADGTLTYWLTADGYGTTAKVNESVYAEVAYAITTTLDFCTNSSSSSAVWAYNNDTSYDKSGIGVTTDDETRNYYKYLDQSGNIVGDGVLAVSAQNGGQSWRIDKNSGGVHPYNKTEYLAVLDLTAGQIVQIKCSSAPTIVSSNISVVPAATYTGTYTYVVNTAGDAIVSLGKDYGLKKVYVCSTSVSKTITADWATYCSPYALDFSSSIDNLEAAYIVTGGNGTVLTTEKVTGTVAANTGLLLLKGSEGTVSIPVVASGTNYSATNKLVGVTTEYNLAAGAGYVLLDGDNGIGFYKNPDAAFTVGANTAYIPVGSLPKPATGGAAPAFYSLFDSETTGIGAALVNSERVNNEVFNLQGQRVSQPTKGLYIVGGRKVVVK